jgi:type II secretory pathway pseudopilin PulG
MTPGRTPSDRRRQEAGYALVAAMATITLMLIAMGTAAPTWKYVMQNEREEELLFRGMQMARALQCYQQKNGNALPTSLEQLVKSKCARKSALKDPMVKDGEWRLVRQGEALPGTPAIGLGGQQRGRGASPSPTPSPSPTATPRPGGLGGGTTIGAIAGVASRSTEKGLRVFNGRERYNEWVFVANQPNPEWVFHVAGVARCCAIRAGIQQIPGAFPGGRPGQQPGGQRTR